jgi:hypothetical protein
VLASLAALAGAAPAAAQWTDHQVLCRACSVGSAPLATAPNGDAVAAWVRGGDVWAATRRGDGRFARAVRLGMGTDAELAIGADGTVAAAWRVRRRDRRDETVVRVRPPGSAWGAPVVFPIRLPGLALDRVGRVHLVGNELGPGGYRVTWRSRPAGGEWSGARAISDVPELRQTVAPLLAIGPRGDLLAAWGYTTEPARLMTAYRPADGDWQPPEQLAPSSYLLATAEAIGLDGRGNAVALFRPADAPGGLSASHRPASGPWGAPTRLDGFAQQSAVGFDNRGNVIAAWHGSGGRHGLVKAARRNPTSGAWSTPTAASNGQRQPGSLGLAVTPNGTSRVAWHEARPGRGSVVLSSRGSARTGRFGKPMVFRSPTRAPGLVTSNQLLGLAGERSGAFTALWAYADGALRSDVTIRVARYQAAR